MSREDKRQLPAPIVTHEEHIRSPGHRIRTAGADFLYYALLDAVVDVYYPILEEVGGRLDVLPEEVITKPTRATVTLIHNPRGICVRYAGRAGRGPHGRISLERQPEDE